MESFKLKHVIIAVAILVVYSSIAKSEEGTVIVDSRYTTEQVGPTEGQTDLLKNIVHIQFPDQLKIVGEAIEHVLNPSGYQLSVDEPEAEGQYVLLTLPLPKPHQSLGPITLAEALSVLGGDSFTVIVNPVTRNVFFQLKASYRSHVTDLDIENAKTKWLKKEEKKTSLVVTASTGRNQQPLMPSYGPIAAGEYLSIIVSNFKLEGITHDQAVSFRQVS